MAYTATITSKSIQRTAKQLALDVEFTNGTDTFTEKFTFPMAVSLDDVKLKVKNFKDNLEDAQADITITTGVLDLTSVPDATPTASDISEMKWFRDFNRLGSVTRLQELGGMPTAWDADLVALQDKVKTNAKKVYITKM